MDENTSDVFIEEIQHWNVRALKDFLRIRGLKTSGRKAELRMIVGFINLHSYTTVETGNILRNFRSKTGDMISGTQHIHVGLHTNTITSWLCLSPKSYRQDNLGHAQSQ